MRDMQPQIPEGQAESIRQFVFAGQKISAIKELREATGLGLKEAKDVVDQLEEELRRTAPEKFGAPKEGKGCGVQVVKIVCCVLIVVCCAWLVGVAKGEVKDHLRKGDEWYRSEEGKRAAENVLSWVSERGDWPKAEDTAGE